MVSWVPKQQLRMLIKQKLSFSRLEIFKLSNKNVHGVYTTFVFTIQRHDEEFGDVLYFIWYSVFDALKNARPYLGLIKSTVVVVVFDYPGSCSHGIGVSSGIQRILNIES